MSSYQYYGRADFACPEEEGKDLFLSIQELFILFIESMKIVGDNLMKIIKKRGY